MLTDAVFAARARTTSGAGLGERVAAVKCALREQNLSLSDFGRLPRTARTQRSCEFPGERMGFKSPLGHRSTRSGRRRADPVGSALRRPRTGQPTASRTSVR